METKLIRITEISKEKLKEVFTSLYHYLNKEMLTQCHKELAGNKAAGSILEHKGTRGQIETTEKLHIKKIKLNT